MFEILSGPIMGIFPGFGPALELSRNPHIHWPFVQTEAVRQGIPRGLFETLVTACNTYYHSVIDVSMGE